ncbi:glyoxylate reductase [Gnomoniopsis smithogilvyi]|uniref:Glyoxylate reductase n=1 Tax=Gnomoniopsis smithogilvyi TaxID=1191159 RepID=A0A9W8YK29_9PEZI|nr:glyoxylate reductase [Gnomoniopsis smithogilvyi]
MATSSRPKVLLLGTIEAAHAEWATIASRADILTPTATTRQTFLAECATGAFSGALVAYRTFDSVALTGRIDAELLAALPASLRFICHNGAGYDQIDVDACTARGIRVSNVRTAVDDSTADTAVFLLLGALRNFGMGVANLRRGVWRAGPEEAPLVLGREPRGKVLGVLGMGGIGRNFARKMAAFGMRVVYHNRTRLSEVVEREECAGAEYVDFETLLRESDVLSLHLPNTPCHTLSHPQFALLKPGAIIINTARGGVINESALVDALRSGQVGCAGLDVYENEPVVHPGLLENPRVVLVPHMGTYTVETTAAMEAWTIGNVRKVLDGDEGEFSIVPEQRNLKW